MENRKVRLWPRRTATISPATQPHLYQVNDPASHAVPSGANVSPMSYPIRGDGMIYPREQDNRFHVTVREPSIAPSTTVTANIWTVADNIKGGWVRKLANGFNNPHGDFIVRTSLLINGGVPDDFLFRTVDTVAGTFNGSFAPVLMAGVQEPLDVFIKIPPQSTISIRWVNNSPDENFSGIVVLQGWLFSS